MPSSLRLGTLLVLGAMLCCADNSSCHGSRGATEVTVSVSVSTAVTLVASAANQDIRVCVIEFVLPEGNTVIIQGSDSTVLSGPDKLANPGAYFLQWDGQLSTARSTLGSNLQIKLANAPSAPVGVTVVYYQVPR